MRASSVATQTPSKSSTCKGLLIGPLDQRLAQDRRQGFARKAGGAEAGGDDGDYLHNLPMVAQALCELKNLLAH